MSNKKQTILGIDPGFATVGWAITTLESGTHTAVEYGAIETSPKEAFADRLAAIYTKLTQIIRTHKPEKAAVEQLFFAKNTTTAIHVGHARGVILLALAQKHIPIYEYTPLQIKQATASYGRAEKKQIQIMMKTIFKLSELPTPDDAADALALAWLCSEDRL
ncbi:MAG: crossover junction endodeoxyribonuclease RuvC [Patescibacteria group bacterium]